MIGVDCFVGRTRAGLRDPGTTFDVLRAVIEGGFSFASRTPAGISNIRMRVNVNRINIPVIPQNLPTDTLRLQQALQLLIAGQPPQPQARRVGLLLADRFVSRPTLFGLMFDVGFVGANPPREGCAIFLDTIHAARASQGPQAYPHEVRFTSMHELGHVFNLWHLQSPLSFMATSGPFPHSPGAHAFDRSHVIYLGNDAPAARTFLEPGGQAFGVRAPGFPQGADALGGHNDQKGNSPGLTISGPHRPFHYFEPIELELRLSAGSRRHLTVPDQFDPGYGAFAIWIEDPDGERRRYRSLKHFNAMESALRVRHRRPFVRDISCFVEAGGYTFRASGIHRIWVTFSAGPRRQFRSNTIEVEVRSARPRDRKYELLRSALTLPRVASLLYFRDGELTNAEKSATDEVMRRWAGTLSGAGLHYALGRKLGDQILRDPRQRHRYVIRARDHLARAADSQLLNEHRRLRARELSETLTQV